MMNRALPLLGIVVIVVLVLTSIMSAVVWRDPPGSFWGGPAEDEMADWPMVGGRPGRTGEAEGPGLMANPAVIWRYTYAPGMTRLPAFAVVAGGTIYFPEGLNGGRILALDAAKKAERWHSEDRFYVPSFGNEFDDGVDLAVADGLLYFTAADNPSASQNRQPGAVV